jgi:predicted transcriptional regulator of viral defense system
MESPKDSLPAHRQRLSTVLRAAKEVVSVDITSRTLGITRRAAAKLLSRWKQQGWLRRIGHGLYVPVPLDLAASAQVVADPWVLMPTLFNQCYIGGWTAAHHWELTEYLTLRVPWSTCTTQREAETVLWIKNAVARFRQQKSACSPRVRFCDRRA